MFMEIRGEMLSVSLNVKNEKNNFTGGGGKLVERSLATHINYEIMIL